MMVQPEGLFTACSFPETCQLITTMGKADYYCLAMILRAFYFSMAALLLHVRGPIPHRRGPFVLLWVRIRWDPSSGISCPTIFGGPLT